MTNPVSHNPGRRQRYYHMLAIEVTGSTFASTAILLLVPVAFFETEHTIGQPISSAVLICIGLFGVLFSLVADPHFRRAVRWWWLDLPPFFKKYLAGVAGCVAGLDAAGIAGCPSAWIGCGVGAVGFAIGFAIAALALRVIAHRKGARQ